jgi:flagellar basal-body rod modification protein FlgD
MTSVNPLSSIANATSTPATTASAAATASGQLANTYDSFLKLLTTQLQHQDPLSPMDSNQFVSQLVAFAGVEQQIASNSNLEKLIGLQSSGIASGSLGYIGKTIEAAGDTNQLSNGSAKFGYVLPANAASVKIGIVDSLGRLVYAANGSTAAGEHDFTWNGQDAAGNTLPDGPYQIRVNALDTNGNTINTATKVIGKVTSVEQGTDGPMLSLGGPTIPLGNVIAITDSAL